MILFELLALASWYVIAIVLFGVLCIGSFLENDLPGVATAAFVAAIVALFVVSIEPDQILPTVKLVLESVPNYLGHAGIYLVLGAVWSVFKWGFYVKNLGKQLVKNLEETHAEYLDKDQWIADHQGHRQNEESIADEYQRRYRNDLATATNRALHCVIAKDLTGKDFESTGMSAIEVFKLAKLTASRRIDMLAAWIAYWPISILSTVLREFIIDLFKNIVKALQGVYNSVTRAVVNYSINAAVKQ